MAFVKKFFGIILCICAFVFTVMTERAEKNLQPVFIAVVYLCVVGGVLLLVLPHRKKQPPTTHTTTAEGDTVTVQTQHTPSKVPDDVAKEMRKYYTRMQAQRDAEIMTESFRLASTTVNLETFCMRYNLAMKKAHTLLQAEQIGVRGIRKLNCHNACIAVINAANSLKLRVLADYTTVSFSGAESLKTKNGKLNRYIKIKNSLLCAESTFMFMDEYEALIAEVDERIRVFGGSPSPASVEST